MVAGRAGFQIAESDVTDIAADARRLEDFLVDDRTRSAAVVTALVQRESYAGGRVAGWGAACRRAAVWAGRSSLGFMPYQARVMGAGSRHQADVTAWK